MTPEERFEKIEKNMSTLQDQMIVAARIQQEAERRWQDDRELVWEGLLGLVRGQEQLQANQKALQEAQQNTQVALNSLIAQMDRLIEGQVASGQPLQGG